MTTVYVPRLIESAEQAEALPIGTIFHEEETEWRYTRRADGTVRSLLRDIKAGVRVTALVPIEVEVEYIRESGGRRREKTLYVTPWKDPR